MAFTAQDVKTLREMTNVGMMDCKKALQATDGDMEKAVDWLRMFAPSAAWPPLWKSTARPTSAPRARRSSSS